MVLKTSKRTTIVRQHPRHVPVTEKNPAGITIVDRHPRRLPGTYLDPDEIEKIFNNYDREGITYPGLNKLDYKDGSKYDDQIAVWNDYFNKKFNSNPALDPDMVKALIASESGFRVNPLENKTALGISQITKQTLAALQDSEGEAKDFIFNKVRQKDLKNPNIAIPLGIRWLHRKKEMAMGKLGRVPTHEEIILEYKGMLKSKTELKEKALNSYRKNYEKLKSR